MFNIDAWQERAAIMEFDGGLSRFQAETNAAMAQGKSRWEALEYAKHIGHSAQASDLGKADARHGSDNLPRMQPATKAKE